MTRPSNVSARTVVRRLRLKSSVQRSDRFFGHLSCTRSRGKTSRGEPITVFSVILAKNNARCPFSAEHPSSPCVRRAYFPSENYPVGPAGIHPNTSTIWTRTTRPTFNVPRRFPTRNTRGLNLKSCPTGLSRHSFHSATQTAFERYTFSTGADGLYAADTTRGSRTECSRSAAP